MTQPELPSDLLDAFTRAGQEHVFRFWNELSGPEKQQLLSRAGEIDLQEVSQLVELHVTGDGEHGGGFDDLEPAPYEPLPEHGGDAARWRQAVETGEQAIRDGRVAAFTVAGGQGTRLGYDGPKGTFPVTPVTHKTLFQVFAEKIARSSEKYGVRIPWFLLTSEINDAATREAFEHADYFGLPREDVHFIVQGLVPAVDHKGKILLSGKDTIAMTPDGHGGSLRALVRSGAVDIMKEQGIDCISYFQVDNPLIPCIDPAFIGFHLHGESELSSKMIPKAYALEKVGHFCTRNGQFEVIEYSDLPEEKQQETLEDGGLRFNAGSVAIHVFDREFIARVGGGATGASLPFHRADKKIPFINDEGAMVDPESPNGIKFEMFVFDALPLAKNPVIIEGSRSQNFSPVKNAEGVDSPQTCKDDQLRMFAGWLKDAGVDLEIDDTGLPSITFEISPRFAADREDFLSQWKTLSPSPVLEDGAVVSHKG
jgi:UDP-N-acetylglucosamine/UDP-N-acetylgalactosamine diphosphorylase